MKIVQSECPHGTKDGARFGKVELQLQGQHVDAAVHHTCQPDQILPSVSAQSTDSHLRSGGEKGPFSDIRWSKVNSPSSADRLRHCNTPGDLGNQVLGQAHSEEEIHFGSHRCQRSCVTCQASRIFGSFRLYICPGYS